MWVLNKSFCLDKQYVLLWKKQKKVKVAHRSFPLLVEVVSNEYLFEERVSVWNKDPKQHTLHQSPCLLFTLDTKWNLLYVYYSSRGTKPCIWCRLNLPTCHRYAVLSEAWVWDFLGQNTPHTWGKLLLRLWHSINSSWVTKRPLKGPFWPCLVYQMIQCYQSTG